MVFYSTVLNLSVLIKRLISLNFETFDKAWIGDIVKHGKRWTLCCLSKQVDGHDLAQ